MIPSDRRYAATHEWVRTDEKTAWVGISEYAQKALGEITFVDLPPVGRIVKKGEACCVLESVKVASEIYAPISGEISAVNQRLKDEPSMINRSACGDGWILKLIDFDENEIGSLMDAAAYEALVSDDA